MDSDTDAVFLESSADDDGNAHCVAHMFGKEFAYSSALGWMHWTGTHWLADPAEAEVDQAILAVLRQRRLLAVTAGKEAIVKATPGSTRRVRDCKALFRSLVDVSPEAFDTHPDELNVANGVLNLRTGVLRQHAPTDRFTYCLETPYDPKADDSVWRTFLAGVLQDDEFLPEYIQMAVGYTATGHTSEECLWYVFGPSRSGKGAFTETLMALFGSPLSTEVDFATFTAKREGDTQNFDLAPLKPARMIITSESNRYENLNTGKIKQLTGGNYIRCAFKHRAHFTYRPQFKAWLVSNHPVAADVDDDALWYRVKVIQFPNSHVRAEDKHLKQRLRSPAVLAGVLRWVVDGAKAWYAAPKGLEHPWIVDANTREQRADLDMVQAWLNERCREADGYTAHSVLYTDYAHWCKDNGTIPKSARGFTQSLKSKGFTADVKFVNGKSVRVIRSLYLENEHYT